MSRYIVAYLSCKLPTDKQVFANRDKSINLHVITAPN